MASSSTSGTVGQLTKPEYRNWLALGHALTTEMCQGLRPFITRELKTFYTRLSARTGGRPCTCVRVPRRKPNEYHDMSTCAWANIIQAHHNRNKPNWKQSDPAKWMDPNLGPWEIAKLFLPDLGGHADIESADDMDITGILNLMYWCNQFTIPQPLIDEVREIRNNNWVHVPCLELTDADKKAAFNTIENLLQDPNIVHDPDAQQALKEIGNLKCVSDLHSMEARVLADFKEVIGKELSNVNIDLARLKEESARNNEEQSQLKEQQEILTKQLDELNRQRNHEVGKSWLTFLSVLGNLTGKVKGLRKRDALVWLMLLSLCHCYVVLDYSHDRDGE